MRKKPAKRIRGNRINKKNWLHGYAGTLAV